jgi:hypothetical protein
VPLNVIQRQLGHRNLSVTSIYLQGIDPGEIIEAIHARRPPMIPASPGLALPRLAEPWPALPPARRMRPSLCSSPTDWEQLPAP